MLTLSQTNTVLLYNYSLLKVEVVADSATDFDNRVINYNSEMMK